jgi:hypothetical protein
MAAGLINSIPCQLQGLRCLKSTSVGKTSLAGQSTYGKLWAKGTPAVLNSPQNSESPVPNNATFIYLFILHKEARSSCNMASNVLMIVELNAFNYFSSDQRSSKPSFT